jgi:hypothetical protein
MSNRELLDEDGENLAVRAFLMLYGTPGLSALKMKKHMIASGHPYFPDWVDDVHLTKAGAQLWLRQLFALEQSGD